MAENEEKVEGTPEAGAETPSEPTPETPTTPEAPSEPSEPAV